MQTAEARNAIMIISQCKLLICINVSLDEIFGVEIAM